MLQNVQFETNEDGVLFTIDVNEQFEGVLVESISMFVSTDAEEFAANEFWADGDLAVNWSVDGLSNDETAQTMGTLLLRNIHSEDDVTKVMGKFYWDNGFTARLREIMLAHGFSKTAVEDITTSEWGMQDEGRASYDAYEIANEIRKVFVAVA